MKNREEYQEKSTQRGKAEDQSMAMGTYKYTFLNTQKQKGWICNGT